MNPVSIKSARTNQKRKGNRVAPPKLGGDADASPSLSSSSTVEKLEVTPKRTSPTLLRIEVEEEEACFSVGDEREGSNEALLVRMAPEKATPRGINEELPKGKNINL